MNTQHTKQATVALLLVVLSGCADLNSRDRSTIIGAGTGAVAGSLLTNGSSTGTVGGAVVGGVIGNQLKKPPR
ncbi:MAG: glycine zipper 2TM domain-containing protein [Pseudomonadota bacterium]